MSKRWWESRIIVVNIASILVTVLAYLGSVGVFEGLGLATADAALARNWAALITVIISAATIQMRREVTTTVPISGTQAARDRADGEG